MIFSQISRYRNPSQNGGKDMSFMIEGDSVVTKYKKM